MAFSLENTPFKNSAFLLQCGGGGGGGERALCLFLGELFLREGRNGGEVKGEFMQSETKRLTPDTTEAFAFTLRTPRPLGEGSPLELIPAFRSHIKHLLRKPSGERREKEENPRCFSR